MGHDGCMTATWQASMTDGAGDGLNDLAGLGVFASTSVAN
ncbi:hypothetical protein YSA_01062 [Pseudomonas putida ND6]|uniref:Uncharacterized protein n=1 Tax=Pseudomonas putida ND6 TaxID=231023 RepID=I3UPD3_PSEPU|nr:hypothetical protein YSA_01062 [Pseudomonas putida ND6]